MIKCDYVKEDGTVCGQPCNEEAEWKINNQAPDDDDYEEFFACNIHLLDMVKSGVEYGVSKIG